MPNQEENSDLQEGSVKLRSWMRTVYSVCANYSAFYRSLISSVQARHPGCTSQRLQLDCSANFGTLPRRLLYRVQVQGRLVCTIRPEETHPMCGTGQ